MNFTNQTKLAALAYDIVDPQGQTFHVLVARAEHDLRAAPPAAGGAGAAPVTHVAVRAAEPPALAFSDACHGEINRSSVRSESDLAQTKPRCDVVVIAEAHSPTGEPVPRVEVGLRVHRAVALPDRGEAGTLLEHRLAVHGARAFVRGAEAAGAPPAPSSGGWRLTEPEPFVSLPVRYEHAFGGELRVHASDAAADRLDDAARLPAEARARHPDGAGAPIAHTVCPYNPVGAGWLQGWYADALRVERWPAPRIEAPEAGITPAVFDRLVRGEVSAGDLPELTPRGLGVIAKPWQPRLARAGTFDDRWLSERWPDMPLDFDMAYWNGAHPEMQCAHLYGGEQVELWNLLPAGAPGAALEGGRRVCRFTVPDLGVAARFANERGETAWGAPAIDTLIIDLERMRLSLVWRIAVPAGRLASAVLASLAELLEAEGAAGRTA